MSPTKSTAVKIEEPALLIRLTRLYRPSLSDAELYDVTRGVWKLGERRKLACYAMAINGGEVKEVYEIDGWHRAGSTPYTRQRIDPQQFPDRWEFTGQRATDAIRDKYVGRSVAS